MRILLACVNTAVSLIGYDTEKRQVFWYCPGNVLRACGACWHDGALYVVTDNVLQRLDASGIRVSGLPGPHANLAHSVKALGPSLLGVADTGNSRILLYSGGASSLTSRRWRAGETACRRTPFISMTLCRGGTGCWPRPSVIGLLRTGSDPPCAGRRKAGG